MMLARRFENPTIWAWGFNVVLGGRAIVTRRSTFAASEYLAGASAASQYVAGPKAATQYVAGPVSASQYVE